MLLMRRLSDHLQMRNPKLWLITSPNWHRQVGNNGLNFGEWGHLQIAKPRLGGLHINLIDFELAKQPDALKPVRQLGGDSITNYVWIHDPPVLEDL